MVPIAATNRKINKAATIEHHGQNDPTRKIIPSQSKTATTATAYIRWLSRHGLGRDNRSRSHRVEFQVGLRRLHACGLRGDFAAEVFFAASGLDRSSYHGGLPKQGELTPKAWRSR